MAKKDAPPRWDREMRRRLARGEAAALGELYDRFAPLVHGLAHRVLGVLGDEQAADTITREVFLHVWQHPGAYEPAEGPLRSWLAALAHRLAVERLRTTGAAPAAADGTGSPENLEHRVRRASVAARADHIVHSLPAPLRAALDLAYFQRRDYHRAAADLGVSADETRRRLRLGLHLLAAAHDAGGPGAPPGRGGAA
ncbi:RNA polymerase subunit sigma-70 [Streptomyces sp. SAT1]|uniref:sigma-70 family RNA polymerase sigma factor n=1 Tax=Streptomyces sp. SAT1 TaxID=1849967 RepID=UPI0007DD9597|nr:sigma-70 family RNA polymerase sigma factor [Streptomyces sp. SAT1]ANH92037.1 RNA polymerase subunit sigma-70 [Streptomyces sp. SAT1]